jgi:hypothetical protein
MYLPVPPWWGILRASYDLPRPTGNSHPEMTGASCRPGGGSPQIRASLENSAAEVEEKGDEQPSLVETILEPEIAADESSNAELVPNSVVKDPGSRGLRRVARHPVLPWLRARRRHPPDGHVHHHPCEGLHGAGATPSFEDSYRKVLA